MSERVTLSPHVSDGNLQTRAFRSQSFNTPPTLASHRSRRTLSLPAREKPFIPPAPIKETPENSQLDDEKDPCEQQQACSSMSRESCNDEIHWSTPIVGLVISLLLYAWACLLSLSANDKDTIFHIFPS